MKLRERDLLRASTKILTMLLEVDEKDGISLKHLRLSQLLKKCEDEGTNCTSALLVELSGWPASTVSRLLADLAGLQHDRHPPFLRLEDNPENRRFKRVVSTKAADECRKRVIEGLRSALKE